MIGPAQFHMTRSRMRNTLPMILTCYALLTGCSPADACRSLDRLVASTYGFKPSALDSTQRMARSAQMDAFWDSVRAGGHERLECLRAAITSHPGDPYFQFDAAGLLVSLDSSPASKALQVSVLANTDFRDVDAGSWIHVAAQRGLEGFNTTAAATRWLALPDSQATYYLPEHAHQVTKSEGALFLIGALPESLATPYLAKAAATGSQADRETVLWLLAQQATEEGRRAIQAVPVTGLSPEAQQAVAAYLKGPRGLEPTKGAVRVQRAEFMDAFKALHGGDADPFLTLVERAPHSEHDAANVLLPEDLAEVRYARRYFIAAGTPEAIGYYDDFTGIIEAVLERKR